MAGELDEGQQMTWAYEAWIGQILAWWGTSAGVEPAHDSGSAGDSVSPCFLRGPEKMQRVGTDCWLCGSTPCSTSPQPECLGEISVAGFECCADMICRE